jgi:NAD(P)H-nitrite reductase large subunit
MTSTKYLLIGNGLSSSQAAKQLREKDPQSAITMVGAEPHLPYDRPPLSKEFLRGEKAREELFFDPEEYFRDQRIDVIVGAAVERLDLANKNAALARGGTGRLREGADRDGRKAGPSEYPRARSSGSPLPSDP